MSIRRVSEQNNINILFNDNKDDTLSQDENNSINVDKIAESLSSLKSKKLLHNDSERIDFTRSGKSVRSAACENIKDTGGSGKYMKCNSSNSIFDSNNLDKLFEKKSSKELTIEEKNEMNKVRDNIKNRDKIEINDSDVLGRSSFASSSSIGGSKGFVPNNKIGIFDSKEFENLKPTDGEMMEKSAKKKDESWRKISSSVTTKNILSNFIDNMQDSDSVKNNNNHKNSLDKIANILNEKK